MDTLVEKIVELTGHAGNSTAEERHAATRMLMDAVGCAWGAYRDSAPTLARAIASESPHPHGAHVFGAAAPVDPEMATFANGAMTRFLDLNDTYASDVGIGHPSDYISAVLAASEAVGANGRTTLEAIVLSYEVFCRLTDVTELGVDVWDHVVNGSVASAVSTAYVMGLDDDQLRHAIALALVPNLALQATRLNEVSMWKGMASANAARNGFFAARLARAGVTGPPTPFEGRGGLFEALNRRGSLDAWSRPHAAVHDCHLKRFAAGYFSQSAIEAAIDVHRDVPHPNDIVQIDVGTFQFGARVMAGDPNKWTPTTRETADHSLPYVVAHALAYGALNPDSYTPARLHDPAITRLLSALTVTVDEECQQSWPQACVSRVTVTLADGRRVTRLVRNYAGHSHSPLSDADLVAKFHHLAQPHLGDEQATRLARTIWTLDNAPSMTALFAPTPISADAPPAVATTSGGTA